MDKEKKKKYNEKYSRSKNGLIVWIYNWQKRSCRIRWNKLPNYSLEEFNEWILNQNNFDKLYNEWIKNNYKKDFIPSVDRLNDYKTYTLDNIQLLNWKNNREKYYKDVKKWINNKTKKWVIQYFKWNIIKKYYSLSQAEKETWIWNWNISLVCNWKRKSAGGYMWQFII